MITEPFAREHAGVFNVVGAVVRFLFATLPDVLSNSPRNKDVNCRYSSCRVWVPDLNACSLHMSGQRCVARRVLICDQTLSGSKRSGRSRFRTRTVLSRYGAHSAGPQARSAIRFLSSIHKKYLYPSTRAARLASRMLAETAAVVHSLLPSV